MNTIRLNFKRLDTIKFISHLDIMRSFERAINRASLNVMYSEGFNPRPKIVFGLPLMTGLTGDAEYVDITFTDNIDPKELLKKLSITLPPGLNIYTGQRVETKNNIMKIISAAKYTIVFKKVKMVQLEFNKLAKEFMAREEILANKKTKKGYKDINIRPMIHSFNLTKVSIDSIHIECCVNAGIKSNLRPDLLAKAFCSLCDHALEAVSYHRIKLYIEGEDICQ